MMLEDVAAEVTSSFQPHCANTCGCRKYIHAQKNMTQLMISLLGVQTFGLGNLAPIYPQQRTPQIAKFIGPTWGRPDSSRPQMVPMLAQWILLSGYIFNTKLIGITQPVIEITYNRQGSILLIQINFRLQYEEVITSLFPLSVIT